MKYFVAALCVILAFPAIEAGVLLHRLNTQLPGILTDIDRTTVIVAGSATNIEKESREWKDQSSRQVQAATEAAVDLNSDLLRLGTLISMAQQTLATQSTSLSTLETEAGTSILTSTQRLDTTLDSLQPIIRNLTVSSGSLPPIMDNFSKTSAETTLISEQILGVATDTHTETSIIVDQTRKAFAPKNKFLTILQAVGGGTVTGAELVYYLSH